ncbi:FAD-dependent oxidoreductase [Thermosulfurimonas sp. F29]|uniref:FAD-dependent oxidoreductase n=1 Tax=Thermosulfurimonas sp. F29 TaxID=2867247 RepID=UPI001C8297E6|nr:FAD-dependent oxidoreductase [Thermosulfurimonas sp. F29]MBX6422715.1 FAD-dependent oxidoreductase [Thermosulfurimonas sp. F29]
MGKRIVVIGAVACGPKAACRAKRLMPEAEITLIDKDDLISYGGCGIPYYISGDIPDENQLRETSFHMLRDEYFFENAKGIDRVLTRTLATDIDRERKVVRVKHLDSGEEEEIPYDNLVLATGSTPFIPPIPGRDLDGVYAIANLHKAIEIKNRLARGQVERAVIIGAGPIGLEMAEAFADLWGVETTVLEYFDQVLPRLIDPPLARMVEHHLREKGVRVVVNARIKEIRGKDGRVVEVVEERGSYPADIVVFATGVRPNVDLARRAGLLVDRGIVVNDRLQTSDPNIYAGGDCIETVHLVTGKRVVLPLGSLANRQGRVIGDNLAGRPTRFPGVVGAFIMKCFDLAIGACGLSLSVARAEGFDADYALGNQTERAHYYPEAEFIFVELVFDRRTRRVLGFQAVGPKTDGTLARIHAVSSVLPHRPTVEDLISLELAYAPPFNSALDPIHDVAHTAENLLDGILVQMDWEEVLRRLREGDPDTVFVDTRHPREAEPLVRKYPGRWIHVEYDKVRREMDRIPRDKDVILICNSSRRAYEAQRWLTAAGYTRTFVPPGGLNFLRRWGVEL